MVKKKPVTKEAKASREEKIGKLEEHVAQVGLIEEKLIEVKKELQAAIEPVKNVEVKLGFFQGIIKWLGDLWAKIVALFARLF